jgi:hypothetical protein
VADYPCRDFGPSFDAQLAKDMLNVGLDSLDGHNQIIGDALV